MSRQYVTVSIPYVNAEPHLGYALELVQGDTLARVHRALGNELRFLGGTDDHALKNVLAAEAAGLPIQEFVNLNAQRFEQLNGPLEVSFDDFIRTSSDSRHRPTVEKLWRLTQSNGDFYLRNYTGQYCVGCEQFYNEDDLVDGRCPEHDTLTETVSEENWFFRLSRYGPALESLFQNRVIRVEPEIYRREVLAFIRLYAMKRGAG